ncbi:MAG: histidine triad nucleotide-binding protein [Gemmatimonadaceae bacterium]|nr:histidine triad nucleotide-binding protein [Gemmatimonadaceae bacterium]
MSDDCLFCRIVRKQIPATLVYEDEFVIAFRDLDPKAPTHVLVVPRAHVASLADATDGAVLGACLLGAAEVARAAGLVDGGYRTVINTGPAAGQSVLHLHVHVLGGRELRWPPG